MQATNVNKSRAAARFKTKTALQTIVQMGSRHSLPHSVLVSVTALAMMRARDKPLANSTYFLRLVSEGESNGRRTIRVMMKEGGHAVVQAPKNLGKNKQLSVLFPLSPVAPRSVRAITAMMMIPIRPPPSSSA